MILIQGIFGAVVSILDGDHYTVDVLVATYICVLVWKVMDSRLQDTYVSTTSASERRKKQKSSAQRLNVSQEKEIHVVK